MDLFPALIFKTETTGLPIWQAPADDPSQPRIAALAATLVPASPDDESIAMDRLIKPDGWEMPAEVTEKNNLSQSRLEAEGVPIADALDEFLGMLDQAAVLSSFGITFDTKLLRGELRRAGRPDLFGVKPEFCLMRESTRQCKLRPDRTATKNASLFEASESLLGRTFPSAGNALDKVRTAADLYRQFGREGSLAPKVRPSTR